MEKLRYSRNESLISCDMYIDFSCSNESHNTNSVLGWSELTCCTRALDSLATPLLLGGNYVNSHIKVIFLQFSKNGQPGLSCLITICESVLAKLMA